MQKESEMKPGTETGNYRSIISRYLIFAAMVAALLVTGLTISAKSLESGSENTHLSVSHQRRRTMNRYRYILFSCLLLVLALLALLGVVGAAKASYPPSRSGTL